MTAVYNNKAKSVLLIFFFFVAEFLLKFGLIAISRFFYFCFS